MIATLAHQFLKLLPPEAAHDLAKWAMKRRWFAPGQVRQLQYRLFGVPINNRLGLAAGFDKNGELVDVIEDYGFGFVEVGSVTYRGGKGNPKPRMFRLNDRADNKYGIMNRMGLNGAPAYVVAERLRECNNQAFGVNIAKTHDNDIVGDGAIRDIVESYKLLYCFGTYTCFNISCPNTKDGRTFQDPRALRELLSAIKEFNPRDFRPHVVKFSPTLIHDKDLFIELLAVCQEFKIAGYEFCNTLPVDHPQYGKGGMSGSSVMPRAIILIEWARQIEKIKEPIIACGGIFTGQDLLDYEMAGADFFCAYNGFVRGPNSGPRFAHRVLAEYEWLKNPPVVPAAFSDEELE